MNGDGKAVCSHYYNPLYSFSFSSSPQLFPYFIPHKVTFAWVACARVSV